VILPRTFTVTGNILGQMILVNRREGGVALALPASQGVSHEQVGSVNGGRGSTTSIRGGTRDQMQRSQTCMLEGVGPRAQRMAHLTGALPGGGKNIPLKMFSTSLNSIFVLIRCVVKKTVTIYTWSYLLQSEHPLWSCRTNMVAEGSVFVESNNSFDIGHSLLS
jgi:hypothetical protein